VPSEGVRPKRWPSAISTIELSLRRSSNARRRNRLPISAETFTDNFTAEPGTAELPAADTGRGLALISKQAFARS